ncbi:uncharacterized protein LOC124410648 isoform X2 [Diprion similis]|uniref:uncharacterized protein LOC124410648 isoform X2 n=1 Tax=Diprion similis TaxID=362088 RepID=UPI001EF828C3|nr:uncharacterized protein LOC124410648 isoform X2 [Diprion similis]
MRLWFSIPILLILACIILESAAVKTKRDSGDASKYRHKSSNPTEDHYSMNKLDHKKKSRIEKREVLKKKGQHRNGEANEKIDAGKFLKEESKERNGKMYYEEKSGKMSQNKISKSKENVKNDKHTDKVAKAKSKKSKRSTELEAPNETLDNAAGYLAGFKKNAHSNFDPASKREKSKDKVTKKSGCGIGKSVDSKLKEEFSVNSEPVSDIQSPKETTSALDCNDKRGESKEFKKQKMNSEKIKKQKHNNNSNDLHKGNINLKESESPEEKNHEITKPVQPDDTPIYETDMPDKYKSGTCNLEDDHATEQSKTCYRPKESKCHANDVVKNSVAGTKQEDMEQMSAQENKARDNNAEEKNSNGEESISENVVQDGSDTV